MAYTPKTNWKSNDIVKETDFNRIEQGISDLYTGAAVSEVTEITEVKDTDTLSLFRIVDSVLVQYKSKISAITKLLEKVFAKTETYTATVASTSWNGTSTPYSVDLPITGIKATDNPIVDLVADTSFSTAEKEIEGWGYVYKCVTNDDGIKLYATEKPEVDLSLQLKVVR